MGKSILWYCVRFNVKEKKPKRPYICNALEQNMVVSEKFPSNYIIIRFNFTIQFFVSRAQIRLIIRHVTQRHQLLVNSRCLSAGSNVRIKKIEKKVKGVMVNSVVAAPVCEYT